MLAKNFKRLMKNPRFKKFSERLKGDPKEAELEEVKIIGLLINYMCE